MQFLLALLSWGLMTGNTNTSQPDYGIVAGAHGAFPSQVLWPYKLGFDSSGDMVRLGVRTPWRHGAAWGSIPL